MAASADGEIILTTKIDESGIDKGLGSIRTKGKQIASSIGKVFLAVSAAAAAATVAITKSAVSAYADYEQLVGGVETLFKGSAKKVIAYAEDAFYTAGVSANEYMRQVTSFSASLISSTAGDTERAADIANMALIDISDNVNKMGSSMESVQLAYQGFAKQQYMLLDNLKLGYGGTRTEMQRLLKNAESLTGQKYDINNLSDVYSAIHAIQEELGITGTTAKEAEKTISGSANMMKASWKNVLSAIAGGGDLDKAINNLVYSVSKYFENIVPVVRRSLLGIGKLIEKIAPMLVENVAIALIQAIPSLVSAVFKMIAGLGKGILAGIKSLFSGNSGAATVEKQLNTGFSGVSASADNAADSIDSVGDSLAKTGKQAQKTLATFDDLNILSSGASGSGSSAAEDMASAFNASGSVGDIGSILGEVEEPMEDASGVMSFLTERVQELASAFSGLKDIDLEAIGEAASKLKEPLVGIAEIVWDDLVWAVKNVFVPLATTFSNEVVPRVLELVSSALDTIRIVLKKVSNILKPLYEKYIVPLWTKIIQKFGSVIEKINEGLKQFNSELDKSELWQDLSDVLDSIMQIMTPLAEVAIDLLGELAEFLATQLFNDLIFIFKEVAEALGLLAAIMRGDFSDAWDHLKKLVHDNPVEHLNNSIETAKELFRGLGDIVSNITTAIVEEIGRMATEWANGISSWWSDDVAPWFTLEKWNSVFYEIGKSLATFFIAEDGFVKTWSRNISSWWNDDVAPWFTAEKWRGIFNAVVDAITNFFTANDGFVQTWSRNISAWWTDEVAPWFTAEKWKELGNQMADGIEMGFKKIVNGVKSIINNVLTAIQNMANGALGLINSLIDGWNSVATDVGSSPVSHVPLLDLSKYKLPITPLATGGIVPRATLSLVGEAGREAVLPLENNTGWMDQLADRIAARIGGGGSKQPITIEFNRRELGRAVLDVFNQEERRVGTRMVIA